MDFLYEMLNNQCYNRNQIDSPTIEAQQIQYMLSAFLVPLSLVLHPWNLLLFVPLPDLLFHVLQDLTGNC